MSVDFVRTSRYEHRGRILWLTRCDRCDRYWTGLSEDYAAHIADHHTSRHKETR